MLTAPLEPVRERSVRASVRACSNAASILTGSSSFPAFRSDVSWGTKGDNKISTDLGVVKVGPNKNEVEVAVPTEETDINAAYEDAIHMLSTKPPKVESKPDAATQQEDYYRSFRTKCVPVPHIPYLAYTSWLTLCAVAV